MKHRQKRGTPPREPRVNEAKKLEIIRREKARREAEKRAKSGIKHEPK